MSTCARCGLPVFDWKRANESPAPTCGAAPGIADHQMLACRDRELANLRSLLRSVTGKLEEAATRLSEVDAATCGEVGDVCDLVNSVLEALS